MTLLLRFLKHQNSFHPLSCFSLAKYLGIPIDVSKIINDWIIAKISGKTKFSAFNVSNNGSKVGEQVEIMLPETWK